METKIKNERVIDLKFKFNTKKAFYEFSSNLDDFPRDAKSMQMAAKKIAICLSQRNTRIYCNLLRDALAIIDKKEKRMFDKLSNPRRPV